MSFRFRGKRRGPRAALMTGALIAAMLGVATQSASATNIPCPRGESFGRFAIADWETSFPRRSEEAKGLTLCEGWVENPELGGGHNPMGFQAWLQIVDLRAGAKIRLQAIRYTGEEEVGPHQERTLYLKHTARGWWELIRRVEPFELEAERNWSLLHPGPERLFSITNASFFKNATNGEPTKLPFPLRTPRGEADTLGVSYELNCGDEDYEAPKDVLQMGLLHEGEGTPEEEHGGLQSVEIRPFPENYEYNDFLETLSMGSEPNWEEVLDATVSFEQAYRVGERKRRNYVGVYEEVVYIFTSQAAYTNEEAAELMQRIQPGMRVIQFDGGGSAQMYSEYGEMQTSGAPILDREVPVVLAVYRAR